MISRNFSSERVSPPLASGWCNLTSSLNRALMSSFVAPCFSPSDVSDFFSSGRSCRRFSTGVDRDCRARHAKKAPGSFGGGSSASALGSARPWPLVVLRCAPLAFPAPMNWRPFSMSAGDRSGRPSGSRQLLDPTSRRSNYRWHYTRGRDRRRKRSTHRRARVLSAHDASPAGRNPSADSVDHRCASPRLGPFWSRRGWSRRISS